MNNKRVVLFCLFISLAALFSACSRPSQVFETGAPTSDTVFLRNTFEYYQFEEKQYPVWNKVYVETNRNSGYYASVMDFSRMSMDLESFSSKSFKHFDTSMLPDQWLPVHLYKGKYYIYRPGAMDDKAELRDSLLIFFNMEPDYHVINKFERINAVEYRIYTGEGPEDLLNLYIYIIDPVNNIAVWKYKRHFDTQYKYGLYVAKENAKKFALIVNIANEEPDEYEFEQIDFKKLLERF